MKTYSDAIIEHYADRFIALRIARHGVNLAQYLINPAQFERLALEPEPLLPAQEAAVLRIWQRWDTGLAEQTAAPTSEQTPDEEPFEMPPEYAVWEEFLLGLGNNKAIRQRNGAFIEPLHHHRHSNQRNRSANFARKGA
ncbi:hypothetical protein P8S55_08285 [Halomonas sp. M1]|uniref:hypothetical protein n=1 Tax=Halomonas sp. M1 TaxID=3035470 RepID=UPI00248630B1|nr:hypothetical protein [Halomonas sp. M1]WFE73083.1 hypothetical protein P8S55_08285 [Halomonas sp. M1]